MTKLACPICGAGLNVFTGREAIREFAVDQETGALILQRQGDDVIPAAVVCNDGHEVPEALFVIDLETGTIRARG